MDKEEILRRFQSLLDSSLEAEEPPAGLDPASLLPGGEDAGPHCDSYALWSAMTALTQEIKLQGRAFQELNRTIAAQAEKISAERERALQREVERRHGKQTVSALIDLRDRLIRGIESVRLLQAEIASKPQLGWWARALGKQAPEESGALDALIRGYQLGIERLDQTLGEFHVSEIRGQGETFDPRRMNAIDSEESAALPEGAVIEVYRTGYEWNGEVFRPAQVKVSRAPSGIQTTT